MVAAKVGHEGFYARNEIESHFLLEAVKGDGNFLPFFVHAGEKGIINIHQGLSLYTFLQVFHTQVIHSHLMPEDAILRLCVDNDAIEVEKDGYVFCFSHTNFLLPYNVNTL